MTGQIDQLLGLTESHAATGGHNNGAILWRQSVPPTRLTRSALGMNV
jgi:hypothetical protein